MAALGTLAFNTVHLDKRGTNHPRVSGAHILRCFVGATCRKLRFKELKRTGPSFAFLFPTYQVIARKPEA